MSQFRETRNLYLDSLVGFEFPLTYESWLAADDEYKAVLLFVNFFNEIELAWYKEKFSYVLEEDAVSEVNQYLIKNVEKIKADPKRFTAGYIYRVAANCINCLAWPQVARDRNNLEVSNETLGPNGDVVNLYDLLPYQDDPIEVAQAKEAVWDIIAKMGPKAEKVASKLLNPEEGLRVRGRVNADDRLGRVDVSPSEYESILSAFRSNSTLLYNLEMIAQ